MLFLWLSIVVMIPFDMCRLDGVNSDSQSVDSQLTDNQPMDSQPSDSTRTAPIMLRIIEAGKVQIIHS